MRKRKQAKVSDASKSSDEPRAGAVISIDWKGSGIAEIARQLSDLEKFDSHMEEAEAAAEKAIDASLSAGQCGTDRHNELCCAHRHFEHLRQRAYAKSQAIQELIFGLEPTNADEALSLAAVFHNKLHYFVADHCNTGDITIAKEFRNLEAALQAIIRGLIAAGANSPLLKHYMHADDLLTWEMLRAVATREANPFRVTDDPVEGRLSPVKREAAS